MSELIAQNLERYFRKWIEPDFSTTTKEIHTAGSIFLMDTIDRLLEFRQAHWLMGISVKLLVPILDEFIKSLCN
jgi:hypothetical protein